MTGHNFVKLKAKSLDFELTLFLPLSQQKEFQQQEEEQQEEPQPKSFRGV